MPVESGNPKWPSLPSVREALAEATGDGIKVAVIDSGVDTSHPGLSGVTLTDDIAVSCDGMSLKIENNEGADVYGHGTAVASLLVREAPEIQLGSFRALDSANHARSFVIAECVTQAISRGYQVINCSFGCRGLPRYVMDYKEWVDAAYLAGVQVVAACSNVDSTVREWPSFFPSVISVGGIDCEPDELFGREGNMVSFFAKGERVEVPWTDHKTRVETGSSFAAPMVSGKVAKILSAFPEISPAVVKPLLQVIAQPLD